MLRVTKFSLILYSLILIFFGFMMRFGIETNGLTFDMFIGYIMCGLFIIAFVGFLFRIEPKKSNK